MIITNYKISLGVGEGLGELLSCASEMRTINLSIKECN